MYTLHIIRQLMSMYRSSHIVWLPRLSYNKVNESENISALTRQMSTAPSSLMSDRILVTDNSKLLPYFYQQQQTSCHIPHASVE